MKKWRDNCPWARRVRWLVIPALLVLLPFAFYGCGDDDDDLSNSDLKGDYESVAYHRDFDTNAAEAGSFDLGFNGDGTGDILFEAGGIPISTIPFTYDLDKDGTFVTDYTLPDGTDSGGAGIVRGNTTVIAGTDDDPADSVSGIEVAIKKSSGKTNASLNGEYVSVGFHSDADGTGAGAGMTTTVFDGNGSGTLEIVSSAFGSLSVSFTYTVNDDGTFTHEYTLPDDTVSSGLGVFSSDDQIIALVDDDPADGIVGIEVAVKKSSGNSNASLTGEYVSVGYHSNEDGSEAGSDDAVMTFDGEGNGTVMYEAGTIFPTDLEFPFTYSVNDDGTFTYSYTMPDGTQSGGSGIISEDASVIVSTDNDLGDGIIGLEIAIKKSR